MSIPTNPAMSQPVTKCNGLDPASCGNCRFAEVYDDGERYCDNDASELFRHEVGEWGGCGGWEACPQ